MIYKFGNCQLDTDAVELRVDGRRERIEPQVFDLIAYLITNRERVVTKQELLDKVWGSRFVSESALTSRVKGARRAVRDDGRTQHVIRTVHGRGYQFVAPVIVAAPVPPGLTALGFAPLPVPATALVGRDEDLARLGDVVAKERLVTLLGPGGVGKTRLAIEAARRVGERFRDGVCLVELAVVSDPNRVPDELVAAFGLAPEPDVDPISMLQEALRAREILLVLDNVEHVVDAAPVISTLLRYCPGLRVIANSRERLKVMGEHVFDVTPLPVDAETGTAAAVEMFELIARAADPSFTLDRHTVVDVVAMCRAVDGLPLGIELAAGQIRALPPALLRLQLGSRVIGLADGMRDRPARQQTIGATLDWSFHLLPPPEQRLFIRLAVFAGPAPLDAIDRVCGEGVDAAAAVGALVDKSLVHRVGGPDGQPRFGMLELVREYANSLLAESSEATTIRDRHTRYVADRLAEIELRRWTDPARSWIEEVHRFFSDVRIAHDWAVQNEDWSTAARIVGSLHGYWRREGMHAEARAWVTDALAHADEVEPAIVGAVCLAAGNVDFYRADMRAARRHWERAAALFGDLGSARYLALSHMGVAATFIGNHAEYERALRRCDEAIAMARTLGEETLIAAGVHVKGELARVRGDDELARPAYEEGLELSRVAGDVTETTVFTANLAFLAEHRGDYEEANRLGRTTLRLCWQLGRRVMAAWTVSEMAGPELGLGRPERAARMAAAANAALRKLGSSRNPADQPEHARVIADLHRALGPQRLLELQREGEAMSLDEIVVYALSSP